MSEQVTDNFHNDFPARMADGRFITDYTSNCIVNTLRKQKLSGWEYRTHLINNAEKIMEEINQKNNELYGCKECNTTITFPENRAKQVCDDAGCTIVEVNPEGVGIDQEN
tara:strand:+ start:80 stop:409 length:330 start_codon:yes stop_codon:yes gene_type:complete